MFLIGIRHALIGTILGVVSHPKFNIMFKIYAKMHAMPVFGFVSKGINN
jgi:hypothetical protein